jgi:hypothetical protein
MKDISSAQTMLRKPPQQTAGVWLKICLYASAAFLLFLSLRYWKIRSGFSDTPNYIVIMTRKNGFELAHNRYVAVVNQWLPVLLMKLKTSMLAIGISYSFAYTLAPVVMMFLALRWLKQPATALAILLLYTLLNALLFYYTCSELQMGLGLLLLYNGIYDYYLEAPGKRTLSFGIATMLLVPTVVFAHPMSIPVLACWVLFRLLCRKQSWQTLIIILLLIGISYLVKRGWFTSPYEAEKELKWEIFRSFGLSYYYGGNLTKTFYKYIWRDAFLVPLVLVLTVGMLIWQRNWRLLLSTLLSVVLLFTLVIIVYDDSGGGGPTYDHYHEHYMQPAMMFLLLGFSDAVLRLKLDQRVVTTALAAILVISLAKINSGSEWLTYRQKWELNYLKLMDQLGLKKAVAERNRAPDGVTKGSFWSAGNETLFLSALDGPDKAKTLFLAWDLKHIDEPWQQNDVVLMDGYGYPQSSLPARYYKLDDKPYVILEHIVPDSVLEHLRWP